MTLIEEVPYRKYKLQIVYNDQIIMSPSIEYMDYQSVQITYTEKENEVRKVFF